MAPNRRRDNRGLLALLVLIPQVVLALWLYGGRFVAFVEGNPRCDFAVFFTGGTMAHAGQLVAAYDPDVYQSTMRAVSFDAGRMFWLYPPTMALVTEVFSLSTYWHGLIAWLVFGAMAWAVAASRLDGRRGLVAMVVFPPTVIAAIYAQASLWLAALLAEGLRLLERRPVVAGMLFGVLSLKPHWLVVPLVGLLAGRHGRALLSAMLTSAALLLASIAAYGMAPWQAWIGSVGSALQWVSSMQPLDVVSPYAAVSSAFGPVVQGLATSVGLLATAWVFGRPHAHEIRMAIVPIAMSLASPYMHFYDLVMLGIPALVMARRIEAAGQPLLPYAALVGASLWLCRISGALFDIQPFPLFALAATGLVLRAGRSDARVQQATQAGA